MTMAGMPPGSPGGMMGPPMTTMPGGMPPPMSPMGTMPGGPPPFMGGMPGPTPPMTTMPGMPGGPTPPMSAMPGGPGMPPMMGAPGGMPMEGIMKAGTPMPMGPQAQMLARDDVPLMPMGPFPPQHIVDAGNDDGAISTAYHLQPSVQAIRMRRPCPDTPQYYSRYESWLLERQVRQPKPGNDICGWVQVAVEDQDHFGAENDYMKERMGLNLDSLRMCFQSISGWTLMLWRSQADFQMSLTADPRAPKPIAWWDLRQAWDVQVEIFDFTTDICPHRFCVMMNKGCLYFRVEMPEDVPTWFRAIKHLIQDSSISHARARDTEVHQNKRWPAACGLGKALAGGWPIGERALAISFHCYDLDCDGGLRNGELMIFIQELLAGMIHADGRAVGEDRNGAVQEAASRLTDDDLFDRALRFRQVCQAGYTGAVKKDDFILYGHKAMLECLDMGGEFEDAGRSHEACAVM